MTAPTAAPRRSLFRHPDFVKLWSAATISLFGTQVSQIAIPVIAVIFLGVPAWQVALLGTLEFLPFLLFTLPAGVWVDRLSRRRILISGDVGRAVMLATIPLAYELHALTIWQLYVVAFVNGIFTVFFDIADQSYLPTVVERNQLIDANGKLQASVSTAQVIGQPLGGGVVAVLTAPVAIILDAASYAASAFLVFLIRRKEHSSNARSSAAGPAAEVVGESPASGASVAAESGVAPSPNAGRPGLRVEIAEGLRYVVGHRYLRSIAATTGASNLFTNIAFAIFPVFVYRDLGLTPEVVGLIGGGFGAGALLGAVTAGRVSDRFRIGPTIVFSILVGAVPQLLVPLSTHDTALLLIGGSGAFSGWSNMVYNINQVSLRQSITPERMLGRMNATMRFIVWGTIPIGQIVGGIIATAFGTVTAIWIGVIGGVFVFLPVFFSPVRALDRIPDAEPNDSASPRQDMPTPA
ncbi:MAG TPA: MFS transporter [Candidatus Limnocylindrales bacterium]|nr:MFS transporter [Candidatus Limnocylindrales bacterium]